MPSPTPLPRGGTARLVAPYALSFDTFDSARAGEASTVEVLGRTHSRLLQWADFDKGTVEGDLAKTWEQPDAERWVLRLDERARWQDRAPVAGRAVTEADVVAHQQRVLSLPRTPKQPTAQRAQDWARIRKVSSPERGVVAIETDGPEPLLPVTLAGRFALMQAPEAVEAFAASWQEQRPEQVVGSGPFTFDGMDERGDYVFRAHQGAHRPALLDALSLSQSGETANFQGRRLDEFLTRDRRDAASVRTAAPGATELIRFEDSPVITSLSIEAPPWNNPELRRALSGALNRGWLIGALFGGRAAPSGPVPPACPAFAPADAELESIAGYRVDQDADGREARARWQAAGGPGLGAITVDFPSIFDPLYSASSIITARLNAVLGTQFTPAVETYTTISAKAMSGSYGNGHAAFWFGWGPPIAEPDPTRALLETYARAGGEMQRLAGQLAAEFAMQRRQRLAGELALAALRAGGAGTIEWALQRSELFRWSYLHASPPTPFWGQHRDRLSYLEARDANFGQRP
jgi:ABC-type transport system substrate-binding protein